jgi:hypothetical protein
MIPVTTICSRTRTCMRIQTVQQLLQVHLKQCWNDLPGLTAGSLGGRLLHDPLHLGALTSHCTSTRRSCCVPVIFPYLMPPKCIILAQVGHLTVTRRAHQPFVNRTHAIAHTFSCLSELQANFGTTASHFAQSKTTVARHTLWPDERWHECRSVPAMPRSTKAQGGTGLNPNVQTEEKIS